MNSANNYCIILAGGIGKRLWPRSCREKPKQFIDFFHCGSTLLQQTYRRVSRIVPRENIYVSTFADYHDLVVEQLPDLAEANILAEPVQLSTAPATAWASFHIAMLNPEANIFVSPCDQFIDDEAAFESEVLEGLEYTHEHDTFLALGVPANEANSAYGYIQMGPEVAPNLFRVRSFSEKPDPTFAKVFVDSGEFLWNTGLFLWNAHTISQLMDEIMPAVGEEIAALDRPPSLEQEIEIVRRYYPSVSRLSIDLAILEKAQNVVVRRCVFGWADVGSWPQLHALSPKDADGNAVLGEHKTLLSNCRNTLFSLPEGMAVVAEGLDGFLVAADDKMLLICPNQDPGLAKKLYNNAKTTLGDEFA